MLTKIQYEDLWDLNFRNLTPIANNPNICPTDYCDYLIREHMFEDYLDIFRGRDTRAIRHIQLCGEWYYPHPYFENNVCLIDKPTLKYIMIGEAAPSKSGTYFYDINQTNTTAWLSAPLKAFFNAGMTVVPYIKPKNSLEKRDLLLELAKQGYLLIDLFPFAINYNNIREHLNQEFEGSISISETFYNNIKSYIESILNELKEINTEITLAFSGPTKIHHFLAYKISLNPLLIPFGCRIFNYPNYFGPIITPSPIGLPLYWNDWINPNILNLRYRYVGINRVPFYRCCSFNPINGSLHPPHELFIRNAFDLP